MMSITYGGRRCGIFRDFNIASAIDGYAVGAGRRFVVVRQQVYRRIRRAGIHNWRMTGSMQLVNATRMDERFGIGN